jgi:hypothetical protein
MEEVMFIPYCDICGGRVREDDLRYVNIVKVTKGPEGGKEVPVMAEKEACVHCAEAIKAHIDGMCDAARDLSRRGK